MVRDGTRVFGDVFRRPNLAAACSIMLKWESKSSFSAIGDSGISITSTVSIGKFGKGEGLSGSSSMGGGVSGMLKTVMGSDGEVVSSAECRGDKGGIPCRGERSSSEHGA